MTRRLLIMASALSLVLAASPSEARPYQGWKDAARAGEIALVVGAFGYSATSDDWNGVLDLGLTVGSTAGITEILKRTVHEQRPDGSDNRSFPSGHTSISFAAAGYLHARYGWQIGLPAAAVASFVGFSRVQSKDHHWYDVVAGAALGEAAAFIITPAVDERVQILPWADSHGGGVAMDVKF